MSKSVWLDEALVRSVVSSSVSIAEVIRKLGFRPSGSYPTFHRYVEKYGIDISHFTGKATEKRRTSARPLEDLLVENVVVSTDLLKRRLLSKAYLSNICSDCGIGPEWNSKYLVLQLDHINGNRKDNRIENLRLLCPNCHSQTDTYTGRKNGLTKAQRSQLWNRRLENADDLALEFSVSLSLIKNAIRYSECLDCGTHILYGNVRCVSCDYAFRRHKTVIEWPPVEDVVSLVLSSSYSNAGRVLGVSDNAVRKFINRSIAEDGYV